MDPLCGSGHCLFLYSIFGGSKNWRSVDLVHGRESMEGVHGPGSMLCTFAQGCLGRSFWLVVSTCPEVIFSWNFKHLLLTVGVLIHKGTKRAVPGLWVLDVDTQSCTSNLYACVIYGEPILFMFISVVQIDATKLFIWNSYLITQVNLSWLFFKYFKVSVCPPPPKKKVCQFFRQILLRSLIKKKIIRKKIDSRQS